MLSRLNVTIGNDTHSFSAVELLGMLQQALPGVECPTGKGVRDSPWEPKTPAGWWYCAKEKPVRTYAVVVDPRTKVQKTVVTASETKRFWADKTNLAWLRIGGKLIGIELDSLYASQYHEPVKNSAPEALPAVEYDSMTYSDIYKKIHESEKGAIKDKNVANQIRTLLQGGKGGADVLPLLTAVLFVSEVARNHTAFHTNLMLLDLIEKGVSVASGAGFTYTLQNTLWQPQILDALLELQKLRQRAALLQPGPDMDDIIAKEEKETRTIKDKSQGMNELKKPKLPKGGGETALPGGIAPMSHTGSAFGSAFDLENEGEYKGVKKPLNPLKPLRRFPKPGDAMTIVRRKEATVLIRWLEAALNQAQDTKAVALAQDENLKTAGTYQNLADTFDKGDKATFKILDLMQHRVDKFDPMLL